MLNSKGQSLVLFVIVLPILLFILVLVIDIGKIMVLKQELQNISEIVLDYGLDKLNNLGDSNDNDTGYIDGSNEIDLSDYNNIDTNDLNDITLESELIEIVNLNKDDVDMIDIRIENNKIYIVMEEKEEGIFSSLVDMPIFRVVCSYVGYIENSEKRIERVRGD